MIKYNPKENSGKVICDNCGEIEEVIGEDIFQLLRNSNDLGWKISKTSIGWECYCIECDDL